MITLILDDFTCTLWRKFPVWKNLSYLIHDFLFPDFTGFGYMIHKYEFGTEIENMDKEISFKYDVFIIHYFNNNNINHI